LTSSPPSPSFLCLLLCAEWGSNEYRGEWVSQLSVEEIYQAVGKIVEKFALYQCHDCVRAISQWLQENNLEGNIIKIRTKNRRENYILSTRLERLGITESITDNGTH